MPELLDVLLVAWDDVGLADCTAEVCPRLHELRGQALDFPVAISNPVCSQSRAVVLFGALGRTLGILESMNPEDPAGPVPPASWPTLPGVLAAAGYQTCLVGKWHLGRAPEGGDPGLAPLQRGFQAWRAGTLANIGGAANPGRNFGHWDRLDADAAVGVLRSVSDKYATLAQIEEAESWWEAAAGSPRFLHLSLNDPHGPFNVAPPPELLEGWPTPPPGASNRTRFLAKLRAADTALGRALELAGPSSLVIVYADNGTAGAVAPAGEDPERMKQTTLERGIRVPMVARWPGGPVGPYPGLVHLVDVPAAVLDVVGLPTPAEWDGLTTPRRFAISEARLGDGTLEQAVRTMTHKLRARTPAGGSRLEEFYNLAADPLELEPLPLEGALLEGLRAVLYSAPA